MSKIPQAQNSKTSIQAAKQDNYDLIAIGTLENQKRSNEYIIQKNVVRQNQKKVPTPWDSVVTNQFNGDISFQRKADVTDRCNNSSIQQSSTAGALQDATPVTGVKLNKHKNNEQFVNIITASGRQGIQKVETNSDIFLSQNEEQDQLDDLKLFDSSQMHIIYDDQKRQKLTRVKQTYDQIINSPKHKFKLLKRTQELNKRREQLEEKIKSYTETRIGMMSVAQPQMIQVVIPQQPKVAQSALKHLSSGGQKQIRGLSNIVLDSGKKSLMSPKKRKKMKNRQFDVRGFNPELKRVHQFQSQEHKIQLSHLFEDGRNKNNLTTQETFNIQEKGQDIFQQMQLMEQAVPPQEPTKVTEQPLQSEPQLQVKTDTPDQTDNKLNINFQTEENNINETLKSRITPTLSNQFTLIQSLSSNYDKNKNQIINSGKASVKLTSGRLSHDEQLVLEAQQKLSVEISPSPVRSPDILTHQQSHNEEEFMQDDLVVMKQSASKYFQQLQITDFEAKAQGIIKERPLTQTHGTRRNKRFNQSFKHSEARQFLQTAQTKDLKKKNISSATSEFVGELSNNYQISQRVSNNLKTSKLFSPMMMSPQSENLSQFNFFAPLQGNKQRSSYHMSLRSKQRDSKNQKDYLTFMRANRRPQIQTRVSSGGGVIFSPKNDHQLQNKKIQKFLEQSQNFYREEQTTNTSQLQQQVVKREFVQSPKPMYSFLNRQNIQSEQVQHKSGFPGSDPRRQLGVISKSKQGKQVLEIRQSPRSSPMAANQKATSQFSPKLEVERNYRNKTNQQMHSKKGNPMCNLLISKAKEDGVSIVEGSQKAEKNFICLTPNNLSLDFGNNQNRKYNVQIYRIDPERRDAMNKFMKKFDNQRIKTESDEEMAFLIQGKRSALNSPFDISSNQKQTRDSIDVRLTESQNQEMSQNYKFYEQAMVADNNSPQDLTLAPSSNNAAFPFKSRKGLTNSNFRQSRENSQKSKVSSGRIEKEFGTQAQGGSIQFVERDNAISQQSLKKNQAFDIQIIVDNSINSGQNTIKDTQYISDNSNKVIRSFVHGSQPNGLIKIQNEQQVSGEGLDQDRVTSGDKQYSSYDHEKMTKQIMQQYSTEFQAPNAPESNANNAVQGSIFDMYANINSSNQTPLGEESAHENPLLVNSKIFSKSQQLRKVKKKESTANALQQDNIVKYNEDLMDVHNNHQKIDSQQSILTNKTNKRSINLQQSRNGTHASIPSHPESNLSLKQMLQLNENKAMKEAQALQQHIQTRNNQSRIFQQQNTHDSVNTSQYSPPNVAVILKSTESFDQDPQQQIIQQINLTQIQKPDHEKAQQESQNQELQKNSVDCESPSPAIIKTATLGSQKASKQKQKSQSNFQPIRMHQTKQYQDMPLDLQEQHEAFIQEQEEFNIQMQNELQMNLIRSIKGFEKKSMKVKQFDCPLPEVYIQDDQALLDKNQRQSQYLNPKSTLSTKIQSNQAGKKSAIFFQKGCSRPMSTTQRHAFPLSNRRHKSSKVADQIFSQHLRSNLSHQSHNAGTSHYQRQANYENNNEIELISQASPNSIKSLSQMQYQRMEEAAYAEQQYQNQLGQPQQIKLYLTQNMEENGVSENQNVSQMQQRTPNTYHGSRMTHNDNGMDVFNPTGQLRATKGSLYLKPDAIIYSQMQQQHSNNHLDQRQQNLIDTQNMLQNNGDLSNHEQLQKTSNHQIQIPSQLPYQQQQISPKALSSSNGQQSATFAPNLLTEESPINQMKQIELDDTVKKTHESPSQQKDTITMLV